MKITITETEYTIQQKKFMQWLGGGTENVVNKDRTNGLNTITNE